MVVLLQYLFWLPSVLEEAPTVVWFLTFQEKNVFCREKFYSGVYWDHSKGARKGKWKRQGVKKRQAEKKRRDPVGVRGQIGGMFGHAFVNMTEKSEKLSQAKNKPGPFFSQLGSTEAFHCQNYNRGFSDADITSAGGNSVQTTPQNYQNIHKGQLSVLDKERAHAYIHIRQLSALASERHLWLSRTHIMCNQNN